ncbi:MAG TPA: fibronectin type III domain-containing protein, partial [Candidatus Dormibacteraeota bacterium]|nr:fibronectin type III domain-containing protein [Candidatus Dormibacteraeota bacterium]
WTSGPFISGDSQLDVTWNGTGVHCTNAYVPVGQEGWLPINLDQPLFGLGNNPNWGCTQGAASPSPPTQVAAIWSGAGQATITWGAPASDGGSPITGYQVALDNSAFPSPQGAFVWTGLRGGRSYTFGVRAVNAVGVSDWVTATVAIIRMKAAWVP